MKCVVYVCEKVHNRLSRWNASVSGECPIGIQRVAGSDGLSACTWKAIQLLKSGTLLREAFIHKQVALSGAG